MADLKDQLKAWKKDNPVAAKPTSPAPKSVAPPPKPEPEPELDDEQLFMRAVGDVARGDHGLLEKYDVSQPEGEAVGEDGEGEGADGARPRATREQSDQALFVEMVGKVDKKP